MTSLTVTKNSQPGHVDVAKPTDMLTVTVHEIDEAFFSHVSAEYWTWQELFDRDAEARAFQHPDFVLTELRVSRESHPRPAFFVKVMLGSSVVGGAVLVPKSIAGEKRFGPAWNLKGYRLAGNRLLGCRDLVFKDRVLQEIARLLVSTGADFLLVEDVEEEDPVLKLAGSGVYGMRVFRPNPFQTRHRIEMPESIDDYWQKFGSKTRNTLRRKVKQFGDCELNRITSPDQIPEFLIHANRISQNSWQSELLGLRVLNDESELQQFTMLATQGAFRSYLLWRAGKPVSFCIGTQVNGLFSYEEVGYDRDFARKSPGQVLVIRMLEDLFEHQTPQVFDFGGGDAEYKRQFSNQQSKSGHVWLLRPGVRSTLIVGYLSGRRMLGQSLRAVLQSTGLMEKARQWTRRGVRKSN